MKRQMVRLLVILLTILLMLSACGKETEENRYIDCEPGYKQPNVSASTPDGDRVWSYSMQEYLKSKNRANFSSKDWLPWEQFSSLGEFYSSFWWEGQPGSSQYKYQYTDPATGNTWIYHVEFDKIREDSGVTNIKEYDQWYYGKEIVEHPTIMNTPTLTATDFQSLDLTDVDLENPIFSNCKNKYGDFGYYIDDVMELTYYDYFDTVRRARFVYNNWLVKISKYVKEEEDSSKLLSLGKTDSDIIQRLTNINTYKQAIKELMDPANALPKAE